MAIKTLENKSNIHRCQQILSDPYKLKKLVGKMQQALDTGPYIDFNSLQRFSYSNNNRYNPFGYDIKKGKKKKYKKLLYTSNCLRHKLIRIQKEFKFVKKNLNNYQELTLREKEIIQLLASGYNNPQIAEHLYISRCTVEQHRKNINFKLKIKSFPNLVHFSYAFDLF